MKRIYLLLIPVACLLLGACTSYNSGVSYKRYGSGYNTRYGYTDPWEVGYVSPNYRPYRPYQRSFFGFGSYHGNHHHYDTHDTHHQSQSGNSKSKSPDGGSTFKPNRTVSPPSSSGSSNLRQNRTNSGNSSKGNRPSGGSTFKPNRTVSPPSSKNGRQSKGENSRSKR